MIKKLLNIVAYIGRISLNLLDNIGEKIVFIVISIISFFLKPVYYHNFFKQFIEIAFFSLPVVALTSIFSGMVLAIQTYIGFARFSAEGAIANVLVVALTRELAPVLSALMVAGRISGAIAAEIGTMRVSEQIDALYTMGVNPIKYLITPRIIAGILALPVLVFFADVLGIFGGMLVSVLQLNFNATMFLQDTLNFLVIQDVVSGLVKASVFGLIITSIGCFYGYFATGGAKGVGSSTTMAVVMSCILIFLFDYILTNVFFGA